MKKLLRPNISGHDSYDTCVSGVEAGDLKNRLVACHDTIDERNNEYINQANAGNLSSLLPLITMRNEDPIVIGNVSKSELVKLYDYYMVQRQPARGIYDAILVAANDKCPFCGGIGRPKTLDHYLPKANYPQFSVLPYNLVPACRDCNTGKSNSLATNVNEQVIHPYFDADFYFSVQWIFARVVQTEPCSLEFFVTPPVTWQDVPKERVKQHFKDFDLAKRYSIQTAEELSTVMDQRRGFMREFTPERFCEYLRSVVSSSALFANHWKRVMYQALANDVWFCTKQF